MKVVINIDKCRKSYEAIDSPFQDIETRYNELPDDIKEGFNTEEILNRSLLSNKITMRTMVNLWNNIKDIFLDKFDISEHIIDKYVSKYGLNKETVEDIIDVQNILDCIKKDTIIDLDSFCFNYFNDVLLLKDLEKFYYDSELDFKYRDTGKDYEYKKISRLWNNNIMKKLELNNGNDQCGIFEQIYELECCLTINNRYNIDILYPNLFVKTLRYWDSKWDNVKDIRDINKAFELKDNLTNTKTSVREVNFVEKNFRFETMSKVCDILDVIKTDEKTSNAVYFTDLYLISAIPNAILRNRMLDTYRQHYKEIWGAGDIYHRLIFYYSSYFIPTLSIIYKYHILKLASNREYEFSMTGGTYFSEKKAENIIISKLRHKEHMSIFEQANLIKEMMNIVTANNAIGMEQLIQELLKLWSDKLSSKEQREYDWFDKEVLSFINWMEDIGNMNDTRDMQLNDIYEELSNSNKYYKYLFLLMFSKLLKILKNKKKLSINEKLIKEIAEKIVVGYDEIALFISNIIPLQESYILYRMNRLFCSCDESINSYKESSFYKKQENNKEYDYDEVMQFNIFFIVFNDFEYSFIFDDIKYSHYIENSNYKKSKKLQDQYSKSQDKKLEDNSMVNIVEYLKKYIPIHTINNLPNDHMFIYRYIENFPRNVAYRDYSLEEKLRKDKANKNKNRK